MSVTLTNVFGDIYLTSSSSTNKLPTAPSLDALFSPGLRNNDLVSMGHGSTLNTYPAGQGGSTTEGSSAFFTVWAVVVLLMTLAVITLVANGTILTMFVLRKSLRKCKNVYIASLAAADLAIGLTIPVAILEQVEKRWTLDGLACRLYLTLRSSLLYVSLLSILLITIDRWWSIHYPFSYRVRQSKRLAACAVGLVWVISFAVHLPPIMLWGDVFGTTTNISDDHTVVAMLSSMKSSPQLPSSLSSRQNPSSLLFALTTTTTTESAFLTKSFTQQRPLDIDAGYNHRSHNNNKNGESTRGYSDFFNAGRRCELPYASHFNVVLTQSVLQYFFPLLALWVLNSSLYFKITRRKSIKIRRSLSVTDHHLLTLRKSSSESESSPNGVDSESLEIPRSENRQRLLAAARAGRRHTYQFCSNSIRGGGGLLGGVGYHGQSAHRPMFSRRTSLQDALPGVGTMAALAGAVPYLPRVTSCQRFLHNGSSSFLAGSSSAGPRGSALSVRKQSDDLVKELLVRQDKKAARCLGLLVTVLTICWLPYTVMAVLRSTNPYIITPWVRDLLFWVLLTNSAINPFLYGLLNAEFRKILYAWFYFRRRKRFRLKQALLYWSLPPRLDTDSVKEKPHWHFRTIRE